jgi:hypothetical protein
MPLAFLASANVPRAKRKTFCCSSTGVDDTTAQAGIATSSLLQFKEKNKLWPVWKISAAAMEDRNGLFLGYR